MKPSRLFASDVLPAFLSRHARPLLLLLVLVLAYGLQIQRLGFYWDDWVYVYRYHTLGLSHVVFYQDTRQAGNIAMFVGFLLSGDSPLRWHLYLLLLRGLTGLLMGWGLDRLWPGHRGSITLMVLLFVLYPSFSQQSIAVVYGVHFFTFSAFFLSLALMIRAARDERRSWLMTGLALLFQALHLFVLEYFFGLEFLRPLILFFMEKDGPLPARLRRVALRWIPYLAVLAVYLVWRLGVFGGGFGTYDHVTLPELLKTGGLPAVLGLARDALQDLLVVLVTTWGAALQPALIDWAQPYNLLTLVLAIVVAFGLAWVLRRVQPDSGEILDPYLRQALILGSAAVVLGFLPAWYVDQHIVSPGHFGDRYSLASTFGAAVLLVALADWVADRASRRNVLLASLLVGLALGVQMRDTNTFRWEWRRQLDVYWQLFWRAPALQPGTVVMGDGALSTTVVNYIGAFALNELYDTHAVSMTPPIWYINYDRTPPSGDPGAFLAGKAPYVEKFSTYTIPVTPGHTLALAYEAGSCVRILARQEIYNAGVPEDFLPAALLSDPRLILTEPAGVPPARIFGAEPAQDWCYYFEKADLARHQGDWAGIVRLKKEADRAGAEPSDLSEILPFVEAYAMRGDWDGALTLSLQAADKPPRTRGMVCSLWDRLSGSAPDSAGYPGARAQLDERLSCEAR